MPANKIQSQFVQEEHLDQMSRSLFKGLKSLFKSRKDREKFREEMKGVRAGLSEDMASNADVKMSRRNKRLGLE